MSTEEKAKAYDEALEKARQLCAYPTTKPFISDLQDLFPELKESEGERIRKKIIATIHLYYGEPLEDEAKEMIFWLKKQGEQKSDDKVEPKFHEGEWIVFNGLTLYVKEVVKGFYRTISKGGVTNSYDWGIDNAARLWTIQDAKDGDVLCTYECGKPKIVFILKGAPKKPYVLGYHCYYNIMYPHFDFDSERGCLAPNEEDIKPATKEQRDTLEKAMADAGYTFDFENKELKKIEQKPDTQHSTEWSEEDEETLKDIITSMTNLKDSATSDALRDIYNSKIAWLKSLRPNHWKPSNEYMKTNE